jgi:hypothetical protein
VQSMRRRMVPREARRAKHGLLRRRAWSHNRTIMRSTAAQRGSKRSRALTCRRVCTRCVAVTNKVPKRGTSKSSPGCRVPPTRWAKRRSRWSIYSTAPWVFPNAKRASADSRAGAQKANALRFGFPLHRPQKKMG